MYILGSNLRNIKSFKSKYIVVSHSTTYTLYRYFLLSLRLCHGIPLREMREK